MENFNSNSVVKSRNILLVVSMIALVVTAVFYLVDRENNPLVTYELNK